MKDSPDYKRHMAEYERTQLEGLNYVDHSDKGKQLGGSPDAAHGYIWLFRRK
jgi:hypothetical protein